MSARRLTVVVAPDMITTKLIDKIFGLLIRAELVFIVWFIFNVLESFLEFYRGIPLIMMVLRITLHFSLGLLAAIQLFRASHTAKWFFSSYVVLAVVEKLWRINPNAEKYMVIVREAQSAIAHGSTAMAAKASAFRYPSWWVWVLYCVGLLYIFVIRERCNKTVHRIADKSGSR